MSYPLVTLPVKLFFAINKKFLHFLLSFLYRIKSDIILAWLKKLLKVRLSNSSVAFSDCFDGISSSFITDEAFKFLSYLHVSILNI